MARSRTPFGKAVAGAAASAAQCLQAYQMARSRTPFGVTPAEMSVWTQIAQTLDIKEKRICRHIFIRCPGMVHLACHAEP